MCSIDCEQSLYFFTFIEGSASFSQPPRSRVLARLTSLTQIGELARRLSVTRVDICVACAFCSTGRCPQSMGSIMLTSDLSQLRNGAITYFICSHISGTIYLLISCFVSFCFFFSVKNPSWELVPCSCGQQLLNVCVELHQLKMTKHFMQIRQMVGRTCCGNKLFAAIFPGTIYLLISCFVTFCFFFQSKILPGSLFLVHAVNSYLMFVLSYTS